MPTITLNKKVFEELVGKELPLEELKDRISMLGTDLEGIEGNEITVEVFPNRPDMLSEQGFARAFSSFIGVKTGLREYKTKPFGSTLTVTNLPKEWPFAVACVVKGIKFDDEKIKEVIQLQEKLGTTFTRNRKKGGIGLYPLEKINFPITFTGKKPEDIKFRPLEFPEPIRANQILANHPKGKEYGQIMEGWEKYPVFIDAKGIIMSMPPLINSHDVGKIDETTTNVFIECTGPDLNTLIKSLTILTTSLADMGGEIFSLEVIYPETGKKFTFPDFTPEKMKLDLNYVNKRLGLNLSETEAVNLLKKMGFGYEKESSNVLIPAYRTDIIHQVDLVEDIAIAYGYENFVEEIPNVSTIGEEAPFEKFARKVREILIGFGLLEAKNFHLLTAEELNEKMNKNEDIIPLKNALGEYNHLRNRLLSSLMKNLKDNKHNEFPQNIFEIGRIFNYGESETGVIEKDNLAVVLCHEKTDFTEIRQILDGLMDSLGLNYEVKETSRPSFIQGRVGEILIEGNKVGIIGEIHPQVLVNWELSVPAVGLELKLESVFKLINNEPIKEIKPFEEIKDNKNTEKKKLNPNKEFNKTETKPSSEEFDKIYTERLFYQDPYMKEAEAKVEEINGKEIILNKTLFFAFSGGQASDSGEINGIKIIDVKKENHKIVHLLEKEPDFKIGDTVKLKLDWERRYRLMKLHSAAHLIYYPFVETLGKPKIIGSNINEDKSRIDFIYDSPISEKIPLIEKEANRVIAEGLNIITEPDEKNPEKRWWKCKDWKMPCGGTHVKNTSEIGKIILKRKNIGKGKERVEVYLDS
ncbi:MAG: phenylalanine--tRNA ligase subunit beta [Candidatus Woesearchaeota archaeon]